MVQIKISKTVGGVNEPGFTGIYLEAVFIRNEKSFEYESEELGGNGNPC